MKILLFNLLCNLLLLQNCNQKKTTTTMHDNFPYSVTTTAPKEYPTEVHLGFFTDDKNQLITGVPKTAMQRGRWQGDGAKDGQGSTIISAHIDLTYVAYAARHFVHVVKHAPYVAKTGILFNFQNRKVAVYDLQKTPISVKYHGKLLPEFGVLGMLLQEYDLLDVRTKVDVRFVGIYDTVPHHGIAQGNDAKSLGLHDVNKAKYVVHMIAEDEYRANFDLVKISSVVKTSPDNDKTGGIELTYPGVHCDVGGAYVEGGRNLCYRILLSHDKDVLEREKKEFIKQGWFKKEELNIKTTISEHYGKFRLEGDKYNVSNQYSYIPLHIMSSFCLKREVPINDGTLQEFKTFSSVHQKFLKEIKKKLQGYSFRGEQPIKFIENGKENKILKDLRYGYLHWNATYGSPREAFGTWISGKNHPNIENDKRMRNVH